MHQRNVVVHAYDVAQCTQPLFNSPNPDLIRQRIPQVLKLLVRCRCWNEQSATVSGREAPDYARAGNGAVHDGDYGREFGFEDAVEGFACAQGGEGVGVCEGREDANSVELLINILFRGSLNLI